MCCLQSQGSGHSIGDLWLTTCHLLNWDPLAAAPSGSSQCTELRLVTSHWGPGPRNCCTWQLVEQPAPGCLSPRWWGWTSVEKKSPMQNSGPQESAVHAHRPLAVQRRAPCSPATHASGQFGRTLVLLGVWCELLPLERAATLQMKDPKFRIRGPMQSSKTLVLAILAKSFQRKTGSSRRPSGLGQGGGSAGISRGRGPRGVAGTLCAGGTPGYIQFMYQAQGTVESKVGMISQPAPLARLS